MTAGEYSIGQAAEYAFDIFKVGSGERPDLVRTGIPIVDETIGGLFPGTLMVIGADQGVGKSGVVLSAMLETPERVGAIFLEDGPDLVGGRALSYFSGVNSRKLRFSDKLTPGEIKKVEHAKQMLAGMEGVECEFRLGGSMEEIEDAVGRLGELGCRIIYLDYLQKVRGVNDNRRSEIGIVLQRFQRACQAADAVPVLATQLKRRARRTKDGDEIDPRFEEPHLDDFKESGDIEAEARVAVLLWPDHSGRTVHVRLAKSSFGGEGAVSTYTRLRCGSLRPSEVSNEWGNV